MTAYPADCDFCAIAWGDADPSPEVICEDDQWVAFFPLEPATPGHTLIIPRTHASALWDLDRETAQSLMDAVLIVGRAIRSAISPEGMNLITSSGKAAEQTVYHVHLHVVPRWQGDGFGRIWPQESHVTEKQERDVAQRIREACAVTQGWPGKSS